MCGWSRPTGRCAGSRTRTGRRPPSRSTQRNSLLAVLGTKPPQPPEPHRGIYMPSATLTHTVGGHEASPGFRSRESSSGDGHSEILGTSPTRPRDDQPTTHVARTGLRFELRIFVAGWSISSRSHDPNTRCMICRRASLISARPTARADTSACMPGAGRSPRAVAKRRPVTLEWRHTRLASRLIHVFSGVYSWFHLQCVFGVLFGSREGVASGDDLRS